MPKSTLTYIRKSAGMYAHQKLLLNFPPSALGAQEVASRLSGWAEVRPRHIFVPRLAIQSAVDGLHNGPGSGRETNNDTLACVRVRLKGKCP